MHTEQFEPPPTALLTTKSSKKKLGLWVLLIILTGMLTYGSVKIVFFLRRTIFFDKLIYQKDTRFGYVPEQFDPKEVARLNDIVTVFLTPNSQVLGAHTDMDVFNIAVLGDSWTFGAGVPDDEVYTQLLEAKFAKQFPGVSIQVYNLAFSGDNLFNHYLKIKDAKERGADFDLTIVQILDNDFTFNHQNPGLKEDFSHHPVAQEILTSECQNKPMYFAIQKKAEVDALGDQDGATQSQIFEHSFDPESANVCFFSELMTRFDKDVVFFYPQFSHWNSQSHIITDLVQHNGYRLLTLLGKDEALSLNLVDTFQEFFFSQKDLQAVSMLEKHPSSSYHQLMADEVFTYILQTPEWQKFLSEHQK